MSKTPSQHRALTETVLEVMEANVKVPQKFLDHARRVGSTIGFAEETYRNWIKRGLSEQQILDKITRHGESRKVQQEV